MDAVDTIAAVATPAGNGGVGVVRVSGPRAASIMEVLAGRRLVPRTAGMVRFLEADGSPIDEGIGLFFPGPRSYTGEDVFEAHGHGGRVVMSRLLRRCIELGARCAEPGEFTKRAFLNGKLDLARAEAVADLISARTEQAARSAARSLVGDFSLRVEGFQRELTELRTLIEGCLDFPEEGIDFLAGLDISGRIERLWECVGIALRAGEAGRLLSEGLSIALIGAPNCGKSSIINMLCRDDVAIVSPVAGTTRDPVRELIQIDGVPVQIVDTAGLRVTSDVVEEMGIARTWKIVDSADALLLVIDESALQDIDPQLLARIPAGVRRIWVHNKIDLTGGEPHTTVRGDDVHVWVSAKMGAGLPNLQSAILAGDTEKVVEDLPFSARDRHLDALRCARGYIESARTVLGMPELAAEELRLAQAALSEITGDVVADDILGEIFSKFCIGK